MAPVSDGIRRLPAPKTQEVGHEVQIEQVMPPHRLTDQSLPRSERRRQTRSHPAIPTSCMATAGNNQAACEACPKWALPLDGHRLSGCLGSARRDRAVGLRVCEIAATEEIRKPSGFLGQQQEPARTSKNQQEPARTSKNQQEPARTSKNQQEPARTSKI